MEFGYPSKVKIADLYNKLEPTLEPCHISLGKNVCCVILLLGSGFESKDFKIGETEVHIRPGNWQKLEEISNGADLAVKFKSGFIAYCER